VKLRVDERDEPIAGSQVSRAPSAEKLRHVTAGPAHWPPRRAPILGAAGLKSQEK
jgi:hypothetical protein